MPRELVARARALAHGGRWTVPPAVPAATVALVRDGDGGLEVLLMRRPGSMAFAPGMHVFPGGRVDPQADARPLVRGPLPGGDWIGPPGPERAARAEDSAAPAGAGGSKGAGGHVAPDGNAGSLAAGSLAAALVVAGVRETFEEAGVLLAVDAEGRTPVADADWAEDRAASETAAGFPEVLERRGLVIDAGALVPVAHWITPEVEGRRFDTRFLLAALPEGQSVLAHETETAGSRWMSPDGALTAHAGGSMPMLPPTVAVLADLAGHPSTRSALDWARTRTTVPLLPRARLVGDALEWVLVHGYTGAVLAGSQAPAGSEERGTG